ncbi:hypothetical protein BOS5A_230943 [Bosea sp. EC-HK365B]|nr:hypothetical protein BOS5A_230943 [Bosea sp. EC-HK365B]
MNCRHKELLGVVSRIGLSGRLRQANLAGIR